MEVLSWDRPFDYASVGIFLIVRFIHAQAAASLQVDLRHLVPMCCWFLRRVLATMSCDAAGMYWQENRKRGEMSGCISSKYYEHNITLTIDEGDCGEDTCSASNITADGWHGVKGKGGGSRSHCRHCSWGLMAAVVMVRLNMMTMIDDPILAWVCVGPCGCFCVLCFVCGAVKTILPSLTIHQFIFGIMVDLCTDTEDSES